MKTIQFYADVTKVGLPFIEIKDEGEEHGSIWLVDTGSNDNILIGDIYRQVKDKMTLVEGDYSLYGIDGKKTEMIKAKTKLTICGKDYDMTFLIRDDDDAVKQLSEDVGFPVFGIIGSFFMAEHGWVMDFGKQEVQIPDMDISVEDLQRLKKRKA